MKTTNKTYGFTLIELMIVVAIIGVLASIAIPSYKSSVERGKRSEARTALLDAVARQERSYSNNRQYTATIGTGGLAITDPTACGASGVQTETCEYTLTITGVSGTNQAFTMTATPSNWTDVKCGALTIDQTGAKTESGTEDNAFCWGK